MMKCLTCEINEDLNNSNDINSTDGDDQMEGIINDVRMRKNELDEIYKSAFCENVLEKLKKDLKSMNIRVQAVTYLKQWFGGMLRHSKCVSWLAKKLEYAPPRMFGYITKNSESFTPRNSLTTTLHQRTYNFWLQPENSIQSSDSRYNIARLSETKYLTEWTHLQQISDNNIYSENKTLRTTSNVRRITCAGRKMYVKSVRSLHKDFKEKSGLKCALSTFYKYKPFYLSKPTEREETCLNPHLLLKGVNTTGGSTSYPCMNLSQVTSKIYK